MDLKDILEFIKKNKELLEELRKSASDVISDAKAIVIQNNKNRAAAFVAALDGKINVKGGEDRLRALNANILDLERELMEAEDTLEEMAINHLLGQLLQIRANVAVAKGFNAVVAFDPDEKEAIARLLEKVEEDIDARKDVKTAIDITVRVISIARLLERSLHTAFSEGIVEGQGHPVPWSCSWRPSPFHRLT